MGLIPVLLLLSNCRASMREDIDLFLIMSNYFFPHSVYPEILQCHILSPHVCTVYCSFNIIEKYYIGVVTYWCSL